MKNEVGMDFPFSCENGEFDNIVKKLKEKYLRLWWETDSSTPAFFKTYSPKEQKQVEIEMSGLIEQFTVYMEQYRPADGIDTGDMDFSGPIAVTEQYLNKLLQLVGVYVDVTFSRGVTRTTSTFVERVNVFDPGMPPENIYQALRNIWIMNTLQTYLKQEMGCSSSMFAYSMLYPYTDNIMDDVFLSPGEKFQICRFLKDRLESETFLQKQPSTSAEIEKKLDALVALIEADFPRDRFPNVFKSLLGIYNAQLKSLLQQRGEVPPYVVDIPGISFEKGGTSVLADGYLIKGNLSESEEDFCFGLGTFLQLADDIQDIVPDCDNNHMTLFSHTAGKYHMDVLADKLFHYIDAVLELSLNDPALKNLKELMHRSYYIHIIEAVGKNSKLYSPGYIEQLEPHFPCRFSYLKKMRKKLNKILQKQKNRTFRLDVVSAGLMALSARVYE
jgi:hypothetical protein